MNHTQFIKSVTQFATQYEAAIREGERHRLGRGLMNGEGAKLSAKAERRPKMTRRKSVQRAAAGTETIVRANGNGAHLNGHAQPKAKKGATQEKILRFLTKNPNSKTRAIIRGTKLSANIVGVALSQMKKGGRVTATGEQYQYAYSAAGIQ